jgi:hypothetical protein
MTAASFRDQCRQLSCLWPWPRLMISRVSPALGERLSHGHARTPGATEQQPLESPCLDRAAAKKRNPAIWLFGTAA